MTSDNSTNIKERFEEWWISSEFSLTKNQFIAVVILSAIIVSGWLIYYFYQPATKPQIKVSKPSIAKTETSKVFVHVAGAVKNPGVYELKVGSRVLDAVKKAGGFEQGAYPDSLNLAAVLKDSQKILVMDKNQANQIQSPDAGMEQGINLNSASAEQLEELPGIGETIAKRIIEQRQEKGSFSSIDELKEVEGIGEKKFAKIKEKATL